MPSFENDIACLHRQGYMGEGVSVGHLDTGIDGTHPAFAGRIAEFRRFGYRGLFEEFEPVSDSGWHGTYTAGLIAGQLKNHFIGIAPASRLYSGAVIEEGNLVSRILSGLDWLIETEVKVVNLSVGIRTRTPVFRSLLQEMIRREIVVVCPIGNRGAGQFCSPGWYPEVLTVGAADATGRVAPFSGSFHLTGTTECTKPDLIAPGVDVLSAVPGGKTEIKKGTSAASAQVAGFVALLRAAFPEAGASMIRTALVRSCFALHPDQSHRSSQGMINPKKAFELLEHWTQVSNPDSETHEVEAKEPDFTLYVDPRLKYQLEDASEHQPCEAILEFKGRESLNEFAQFLLQHCNEAGEENRQLKTLKHKPIAICRAPKKVLRHVLNWPSVSVASACDIDRYRRA